jgi:hypothetical protein
MACVACASEARDPPKGPERPVAVDEVERLLPLEDKSVLSYETVLEQTGESGLLTIEVSRRSGNLVELRAAGRTQLLEIAADGVRHATGGYLLKKPLTKGAEFKGEFGRVRITETARTIRVPAGAFENCLETVEEAESSTGAQRSTKIFCPAVGMVWMQQEASSGGEYLLERASLRSFGPRVEIRDL